MGPHRSPVLERWQIWKTPKPVVGPASWSARPIGAASAVVFAPDREELEKQISLYMADIDAHVAEARRKLDALPPHWTGERAVQERLIEALAELAR